MFYNDTEPQFAYFDQKGLQVKSFASLITADCPTKIDSFKGKSFSVLNSNTFVDINGDCKSDLIFTLEKDSKRTVEIWTGSVSTSMTISYCRSAYYQVPDNVGLLTFADIDRNGFLDLVYPILNKPYPTIGISFNLPQMTIDWEDDYCSTHSKLDMLKFFDRISEDFSSNDVFFNKEGNQDH